MSEAWGLRFDNMEFDEFLFITGDKQLWMIMSKSEVTGAWYNAEKRKIIKSSISSEAYEAVMYRRQGSMEDPWIGLKDHSVAI